MNPVYERIAELCREKGITPTYLCKQVGVSPSRMSDLRNGRSDTLSSESIAKLAKGLNVTTDYLAAGTQKSAYVIDLDHRPDDYAPLLKSMTVEELVTLLGHVTSEIKLRTLPDVSDLSELSTQDIVDRIGQYGRELAARRNEK